MISDRSLEHALGEGIVTVAQVERLRAIEGRLAALDAQDDERFRLITGFADIFVTIGVVFLLGSLGYFAFVAAGPIAIGAAVAAASWAVAEVFTRRRRMALPSIVLLLTFVCGVFAFAVLLGNRLVLGDLGVIGSRAGAADALLGRDGLTQAFVLIGACLAAALAAALHYWRFRVPITVAAGVAAAMGAVLTMIFAAAPVWTVAHLDWLLLVSGIAAFGLGMRSDLSDRRRLTRRADVAFWLHLLAAPLIVHPLVGGYVWRGGLFDPRSALIVLAIFFCLGAVAVIVDRRALLVSGLAYAGFACATLIRQSDFGDKTVPATFLVLGAFVLLLSAGWRPLRAAILALLPAALSRHLPNPASPSLS